MNRKGNIVEWLLFCIMIGMLILAMVGCKTPQPAVVTNTDRIEHTETEVPRDTVIMTMPDSASIRARLKCDSLNNVLLNELEAKQGERIQPSINIKQNDDGTMDIDFICKEDSLRHEIELRDKIIKDLRETTKEVPVYIEKPVNTFLKNSGIALWVIIALAVLAIVAGLFIKFAK